MSDAPAPEVPPDEPAPALVMPEPHEEAAPAVTLVVPAPLYESITTGPDGGEPGPVLEPAPAPAPAPPAADLTPVLEAVTTLRAALDRRLDGLQSQFDREVRAEATREKVVDRLHAELQEYKQDLLLGVLRPVFVDLIQLHDDIGKMIAAQDQGEVQGQGETEGTVGRLLEIMGGYQQAIEDILDRQGVEPFQEEATSFDPRRQRAVATVPTDDPALAKTIAGRLRKGFRTIAGDRVIRPEIVAVYALKK